jgi:hypothetical protein
MNEEVNRTQPFLQLVFPAFHVFKNCASTKSKLSLVVSGNTKGRSFIVLLTSCLTGLESGV